MELTVFRRGELGSVEVSWITGTSTAPGFVPGSLLPRDGIVQFPPQQNTTTIILTVSIHSLGIAYVHVISVHIQATPVLPHGTAELFEVRLQASSLDQSFPSQVDIMSERALVEPAGVFQIPNIAFSALEGTMVSSYVYSLVHL